MQNTTNYNFNLPEGTDLWNYLTQTNPNFTALDSIIKGVSDATVTTATEVASGTAHAISRTLPDANVIRFTATSNWTLGDTMTIDGTPVTVVNPNGTNLQTGAYVIGAEVLGVIRATQFTVYLGGVSSIDAVDVDYDNTVSGLTATDVQAAIDEEASAIDTINSKLTWKLHDTKTGTTPITLPAVFNELLIIIRDTSDNTFTFYIPKNCLSATAIRFRGGYYYSVSSNGGCAFWVSLTSAYIHNYYTNGTDATTTASIDAYYR